MKQRRDQGYRNDRTPGQAEYRNSQQKAQQQGVQEPELRPRRPQQREYLGVGDGTIGVIGQNGLDQPLQNGPQHIGIEDAVEFAEHQPAGPLCRERLLEEQPGEEEEQRHVKAVDDAVRQPIEGFRYRNSGAVQPAQHVPVYDQDNTQRLGVVHPDVSILHYPLPSGAQCCSQPSIVPCADRSSIESLMLYRDGQAIYVRPFTSPERLAGFPQLHDTVRQLFRGAPGCRNAFLPRRSP